MNGSGVFMYEFVCRIVNTFVFVEQRYLHCEKSENIHVFLTSLTATFPTAGRPDTVTLCNELTGVPAWRMLGLCLGVQHYELDQIERSHPTEGHDGWKQETFSLWLRQTPNASWRDVVGALRRMGENTEAERIELKYIVGPVHASKLYFMIIKM